MVSQKIKDIIDEHNAEMREKWPDGYWVFASDADQETANEYKTDNLVGPLGYLIGEESERVHHYCVVDIKFEDMVYWKYIAKCDYQGPESKTVETDPLGYYWDDYDLATEADKHEEIAKMLRSLEALEHSQKQQETKIEKNKLYLQEIEDTLKDLGEL